VSAVAREAAARQRAIDKAGRLPGCSAARLLGCSAARLLGEPDSPAVAIPLERAGIVPLFWLILWCCYGGIELSWGTRWTVPLVLGTLLLLAAGTWWVSRRAYLVKRADGTSALVRSGRPGHPASVRDLRWIEGRWMLPAGLVVNGRRWQYPSAFVLDLEEFGIVTGW
jgi:hypothetical protein